VTTPGRRDVIVVGAGNAALCAAIAAAEHGAGVLVLERAPQDERGGNSWFTDGAMRFAHHGLPDVRTLIPEMTDEEAAVIDLPAYPFEAFVADLARTSDGRADPVLASELATHSLPTMRWLGRHGVRFAMLYDNQAVEVNGRHQFWGGLAVKAEGKGVELVDRLVRRADSLGVEMTYGARAMALRETDAGLEVEIETGEGSRALAARTVILACGSFEASRESRVGHLGEAWGDAIVRGTGYNEGDGLRMALALGAAPAGDWEGCHAVAMDANAPPVGDHGKPGDIWKRHSYPLGILVNRRGERFVDEGADFRNYTYARYGREVLAQPGGVAFQIFDGQVLDRLRDEYRRPEATRIEADTLEALAAAIDVDRDTFLDTVTRYNAAVRDGEYDPSRLDRKRTDGIEPSKSNWALRLEAPPFIAFPVRCGITFAFAGIAVNERAEVLREDGTPIPGLLAAGEMVGGLFYGNYPGGTGLMSGAVFGRIAGATAAGPGAP